MTIDKEKLKALAWFTEDHMTDKSATTYDPVVACRWYEKGWPVQLMYGAETINALLMDIGQLKAENEALRKDAERYRWLRESGQCEWDASYEKLELRVETLHFDDSNLDACIDAAMAKEASQ
ncbi:hypothetical protein ACIUXF_07465 [Pseudomonas aeruginosa]